MTVAIIQARMGSTRLPNKVMMTLCKKPVLWHVVNRLTHSKTIDKIIVATSENKENYAIREFCSQNNILCYSGSENDVLDRYYKAAKEFGVKQSDLIIRITADCPLIDPEIVDKVVQTHKKEKADYTSNTIKPTFPDGLDCEVINFSVLHEIWKNAKLKSEREHVTLYIKNNQEDFKISSYENDIDLSSLRWTLDEEEDFKLIKNIYDKLYNDNNFFITSDILDLLEKEPELNKLNSKYQRNEGLLKSLAEEKNINLEKNHD